MRESSVEEFLKRRKCRGERVSGTKASDRRKSFVCHAVRIDRSHDDKKERSKNDENNSTYCELVRTLYPPRRCRDGTATRGAGVTPCSRATQPLAAVRCQRSRRDRSKTTRGLPKVYGVYAVGRSDDRETRRPRGERFNPRRAVAVFAAITVHPSEESGRARGQTGGRDRGEEEEGRAEGGGGEVSSTAEYPRTRDLAARKPRRMRKITTHLGPSKWVTNSQQG